MPGSDEELAFLPLTHLSRLVPQHKMRAMVYTSATATAAELHAFGSVLAVVPQEELRSTALEVAGQIAAKSPTVIRAAKQSLNGIDPVDVRRSYRYEQGFIPEQGIAVLMTTLVILGLFSGAGGRFILYRPGKAPLEAPRVPVVYELLKSIGHSTMALTQRSTL